MRTISGHAAVPGRGKPEPLPALTGIRLVAAAWVVFLHFREPLYSLLPTSRALSPLVDTGALGVEIFFVLSGFIISHNYATRVRGIDGTYRSFLQNRFARVYPVHFVTLAVVAALAVAAAVFRVPLHFQGKYDAVGFVMNIFMLQGVPPAQAWNGPAWSISAEAGAYVVFPLLALFASRIRSGYGLTIAISCALAFTIGGEYLLASGGTFDPIGYPSIWLRIAGEFTAGVLLWHLWRLLDGKGLRFDALAVVGAVGTALVAMAMGVGASSFLTLPFVILFVFGCASATGPVLQILGSRPFTYGGKISYSLYMTHFLVLMVVGKVLPWSHFLHASLPLRAGIYVGCLLVCVLVAALTYHFVEEPARRLLHRRDRAPKEQATLPTNQLTADARNSSETAWPS